MSTDPAVPSANVKFHTSLNVADLARSVAFYRLLFGLEPATLRADYAKFELAEPPLVLTLMPGRPMPGGVVNHFGLRVPDVEALIAVQQRLEAGSLHTQREDGISCCHSKQTKFWIADPDQTLWEIYLFHEGSEDDHDHPHQTPEPAAAPVESPKITWQHRIGQPLPAHIPHDDCSVHEIHLEGIANMLPGAVTFADLLKEARRALRPSGSIRLHGLTGDTPLTVPLPNLPGPAAVVATVPSHAAIVRALEDAGFISIHLETLSRTAHFTVGDVPLREILACARKPGHRTTAKTKHAIYLGPLAEVTDDSGNTCRRGEPVALNPHDHQALANSSAATSFLLI